MHVYAPVSGRQHQAYTCSRAETQRVACLRAPYVLHCRSTANTDTLRLPGWRSYCK